MKKVILFDNDGTLSDSVPTVIEATNAALQSRGYSPISGERIIDGMRISTPQRMLHHIGSDDMELGASLAEDFYREFIMDLGHIKLFEGIREVLGVLIDNEFILGVVSNNLSHVVDTVLTENGVRPLFSLIIGEDNAEETKPGPGGLLQACRRLKVSPDECVYVGDSLSDSLAAEAAGVTSIGIKWNHHDEADIDSLGFTYTVDTPSEIPVLLKQLVHSL